MILPEQQRTGAIAVKAGPMTRGYLVVVSGTTCARREEARTKSWYGFYPTEGACRDIERTRNG
jgi:hypothetical protein